MEREENAPAAPLSSRRDFLLQLAGTAVVASHAGSLLGEFAASINAGPASATVADSGQAALRARWSAKTGPLMTRWSSQVDPKMPLPDYPRPQLVRKEWLNLNGVWEFQPGVSAGESMPTGKPLSSTILVPYPPESALSGVMEHHERLWYRRSFSVPGSWKGRNLLLHFGAVDYQCEVFVNGQSAGSHTGGYLPFSFDVTSHLKEGVNELVVRVFDPTETGGQPRGKQNTHPRGITYTPTSGIWQTVWLEPVAPVHVEGLRAIPDVDAGVLRLTVQGSGARGATAEILVRAGAQTVAKMSGAANQEMSIPIPNAKLWSPDSPHLYSLEIKLRSAGRMTDSVSSYFAMRKTSVGDSNGQKKLLLNNEFLFQVGPLDQGFWPDGIYTAPTDDALKSDIVALKAMGFNMVRKHIKVEPARWYYFADTLGMMVWQDMPSCNSYPGKQFTPPPVDKVAFETQLKEQIETLINVPSIVMWIVFNEGQGQFDTERMVNDVRAIDQSRPINEASGGEIMGFGDVNDIHSYPEPAVRTPNGRQALVCGEFGGIGYLIPEHSWSKAGRGYIDVDTPEDLLYTYAEYFDDVRHLRDAENISAVVYTELTDVMTEINGLLTYDRVPKLNVEKIRQVNTFQFKPATYKTVVPTSEQTPQDWRYTTTKPADDWSSTNFADTGWMKGAGAFGSGSPLVHTKWNTQDLWVRRHFNPGGLSTEELQRLVMTEFHRGRVEVFINGVAAQPQQGNNRSGTLRYEHRPLASVLRAAIVPNGDNVIAVHCHSMIDNPFFDAGFSLRQP